MWPSYNDCTMASGKRFSLLLLLLLSACASYRPVPPDRTLIENALKPPDLKILVIKAANIRHPILRPVKLNLDDGLSPDEAAVIAVIINPTLRADRDRAEVAGAQILQAGLLPNPQLSLSLDIPSGGDTTDTTTGYGLGLGIDLRSLITRGARVSAAKMQLSSVNLGIAWKEWQVAEAAKLHLYRLYYLEHLHDLAKRAVGLAKKDLMAVKDAINAGESTSMEMDDMDVKLKDKEALLKDIDREIFRERLLLNKTMGLRPEMQLPLEREIKNPFLCSIPSSKQLLKSLYSRPDILALKEAYRAEDARLKVAILSRFPDIGIGFDYSRGTDRLITTVPSITIELPFFDHAQGRVATRKATLQEAFDRYTERLFQARHDVVKLSSEMGFLKQKLHILQALIGTLKQQCQDYRELLKEGMIDRMQYYRLCSRILSEQMREVRMKMLLTDMGIALEIASGRYLQTEGCRSIASR